jgi:hypothetical protein
MKRDSSIGQGTSEIRSATFEQVALRRNNRLAELADRKSGDEDVALAALTARRC